MSKTIRVVKRYANRKLYDTHESRYVTLDQISELIRQGEEVRVVDNATKEDLTSVTLAQIIFEEEKRRKSFLPLSVLRKIIQSSGESLHDIVSQIQESAERVGRVFRRDESTGEGESESETVVERAEVAPGNELEKAPGDAERRRSEAMRMVRDFIDGIQHTLDDWQKRLDANVQHAWESVSPLAPLQKEIDTLRQRILELEKRLVPAAADVPAPTDGDETSP